MSTANFIKSKKRRQTDSHTTIKTGTLTKHQIAINVKTNKHQVQSFHLNFSINPKPIELRKCSVYF